MPVGEGKRLKIKIDTDETKSILAGIIIGSTMTLHSTRESGIIEIKKVDTKVRLLGDIG